MSPSQPSKQKRAAQNKNQRAALQQRKAAASAAGSSGPSSSSSPGGGGLFSRLRTSVAPPASSAGGSAARPRGGGLLGTPRADQPTGYRAALFALLAAFGGLVLITAVARWPIDGNDDPYTPERLAAEWTVSALDVAIANPDASAADVVDDVEVWAPERENPLYVTARFPYSLTLILPAIAAFFGYRAVTRRRGGRVVNRAMFATLLGAFLSLQPMVFLPTVIAIGVASFQIRKAEVQELQEAQAADPDRVDDDEVIDAEVVEDEPADDDAVDDGPVDDEAAARDDV